MTNAPRKRAAARRRASPARWWALGAGLLLAFGGLWALLGADVDSGSRPPLDDIDAASRERLERVLRESEASQ